MNKKDEINNFLELDFSETNVSNQQETRIFGEIFEGSLELFDTFISSAKPEEKIEFFVNSGGGSVFDGVAMSSLIKRHKGETVGTGIGFVASIASVILLSADRVRLHKDAFLMIHNASIGFTFGEASQLRKDAAVLDKISNQISEIYVSQIAKNSKLINGSKEETRIHIQQLMNAETWFTAEEALAIGLIDEIAENGTTVEPLSEKELKNILNKYGKTAPKDFLNMCECQNKEITNGARLSSVLDNAIESKVNDDTTRGEVIQQMATAAGISTNTVSQILRGEITCPPLRRLEGFADALDVSMNSIITAANSDGCNYEENTNNKMTNEETNESTFWDKLKALFKANPEKLKEMEIDFVNVSEDSIEPVVDNQEDGEGMDEALAAEIDAAKSLLMANGFIVLTEDEAEEMNNELTAETGKAIEFKDNFDTLSEDYNDIMAKLKEFEKEFSTKSGKVELSNDTPKKQETTREILLKKYAQKTNITNSKFFKNLSK